MNAANRITKMSNLENNGLYQKVRSESQLPLIPSSTRRSSVVSVLSKSSSKHQSDRNFENKYISKALNYGQDNMTFKRSSEINVSDEKLLPVKPKPFREIDRFVRSYRKSTQKGRKIPSIHEMQLEINELEKRRK